MTSAPREPLRSWRYPDSATMAGNSYPSGKPGFAPFPTVTSILNASLCPKAAYHDLLHGDGSALLGQWSMLGLGEKFHSFAELVKRGIQNGRIDISGKNSLSSLRIINDSFLDFARSRGLPLAGASDVWRMYVEPWVLRMLESGHLESISDKDQIFFEITVANPKLCVELDGGMRHYPLTGRIDEIDLTRKTIIERTIKNGDEEPPLLKGYQCWLLWNLISSLPKDHLPSTWRSTDFDSFELIVETPTRSYRVSKANKDFIRDTHWSYAWINDISLSESPGVFKEVYDNQSCSPVSPHPECSHAFRICFARNYPHPQSRPEMKRVFQPWYRLLLWEKLWNTDLWWYQILMLPKADLINKGLMSEMKFLDAKDNVVTLQITSRDRTTVRGYDRYTLVTDGTLFCGKRVDAVMKSVEDDKVVMEVQNFEGTQYKHAILLHSPPDSNSQLVQPPPGFLLTQSQRGLLKLQQAGVMKPDRANQSSIIQLLESVFGVREIKRGER